MKPEIAEIIQEMIKPEAIPDGVPIKPQLTVVENKPKEQPQTKEQPTVKEQPQAKIPPKIPEEENKEAAQTLEVAATRQEQRMRGHIRHLLHNDIMFLPKNRRIDIKGIKLGGTTAEGRHLLASLHDHPEGSNEGYHHTFGIHVQEYKKGRLRKVGRDHASSAPIENMRQALRTHLLHRLHSTSLTNGGDVEHVSAARHGKTRRVLHVYTRNTKGRGRHYIVHIRHHASN